MEPETLESNNVSLVGYPGFEGKSCFKLAIQKVVDRWLLYFAHLFHSGWSIVDMNDPSMPELAQSVEGPRIQ